MTTHSSRFGPKRASAGLLAGTLLVSVIAIGTGVTSGSTSPMTSLPPGAVVLKAPKFSGVSAAPGHGKAPTYTVSPSIGLLRITPNQAVAGAPITVSGTGLAHNASVMLTWGTWDSTWIADPEPNTANYMGRMSTAYDVVLTHVTTSASGSFTYNMVVPRDFGGIHQINAIVNGVSVAYGGLVLRRTVTMTPASGPIGTPITIIYSGIGASLYPGGGSILWDNHYVGEVMANWTRGTARFTMRAAGPVGMHYVQVGDAIGTLYMNIRQSPLPYATGKTMPFLVTSDPGPRPASVTWPDNVVPTVSARTTLQTGVTGSVVEHLSTLAGTVGSKVGLAATGFSSTSLVSLDFVTVVGNRVNCTGVCWNNVSTPLGSASVTGSTVHANFKVPNGLGGWHVIELVQGGTVVAQVPFYVKESFVGTGVSSIRVKQGAHFTVHIQGVGWTQFDNTLAVDYDNSYVGYACGFNSNGNMVVDMYATGAPGTHIIDLYPLLYTNQPSYSNTPYGMLPVLTYQKDEPALALGYHVPSFHFAITVVP